VTKPLKALPACDVGERRRIRPRCHRSLTSRTKVACGEGYSAAVTKSGRLYTWGKPAFGRLGHGDRDEQPKPRCGSSVMACGCAGLFGCWFCSCVCVRACVCVCMCVCVRACPLSPCLLNLVFPHSPWQPCGGAGRQADRAGRVRLRRRTHARAGRRRARILLWRQRPRQARPRCVITSRPRLFLNGPGLFYSYDDRKIWQM
jgi:hypothetical protein